MEMGLGGAGEGQLGWTECKVLKSHAPSSLTGWSKGALPRSLGTSQVTLHFCLSAPAWAPLGKRRAKKLDRLGASRFCLGFFTWTSSLS